MEIERRAADAITRPWIAEAAVHELESKGDLVAYDRAKGIVLSTRQQLSKLPAQASLRYQVLARRAVSLAQLDAVVTRNRRPTFGVRDGVDESGIADEVENLLRIAQSLWEVASERPLWLQPDFGAVAASVGGSSAALLAGSSVINVTLATSNSIDRDTLRVLMGDALIAAASERVSIGALRLYQARFGNMVEVELPNELRSDECRPALDELAALWRRDTAQRGT